MIESKKRENLLYSPKNLSGASNLIWMYTKIVTVIVITNAAIGNMKCILVILHH